MKRLYSFRLSRPSARPGVTLIELLLFLCIFAVISIAILPLLFLAIDTRIRQQAMASVEQNGMQLMQNVSYVVHGSERILDPLPNATGSVLALQVGSGALSPTMVGVSSGAIILIRSTTREVITSSDLTVSKFVVRNTSTSADRQSVRISFDISTTMHLPRPREYKQSFFTLIALFPDDQLVGNACGCSLPDCTAPNTYAWQVCRSNQCLGASTALNCP